MGCSGTKDAGGRGTDRRGDTTTEAAEWEYGSYVIATLTTLAQGCEQHLRGVSMDFPAQARTALASVQQYPRVGVWAHMDANLKASLPVMVHADAWFKNNSFTHSEVIRKARVALAEAMKAHEPGEESLQSLVEEEGVVPLDAIQQLQRFQRGVMAVTAKEFRDTIVAGWVQLSRLSLAKRAGEVLEAIADTVLCSEVGGLSTYHTEAALRAHLAVSWELILQWGTIAETVGHLASLKAAEGTATPPAVTSFLRQWLHEQQVLDRLLKVIESNGALITKTSERSELLEDVASLGLEMQCRRCTPLGGPGLSVAVCRESQRAIVLERAAMLYMEICNGIKGSVSESSCA